MKMKIKVKSIINDLDSSIGPPSGERSRGGGLNKPWDQLK